MQVMHDSENVVISRMVTPPGTALVPARSPESTLAIATNLDALLEYDQRARTQSLIRARGSPSSLSPGLPPPPRKRPGVPISPPSPHPSTTSDFTRPLRPSGSPLAQSLRSRSSTEDSKEQDACDSPNPYLNPAPEPIRSEPLPSTRGGAHHSGSPSPSLHPVQEESRQQHTPDDEDEPITPSSPQTDKPKRTPAEHGSALDDPHRRGRIQYPSLSLSKVDKMLGRAFGKRAEGGSWSVVEEGKNEGGSQRAKACGPAPSGNVSTSTVRPGPPSRTNTTDSAASYSHNHPNQHPRHPTFLRSHDRSASVATKSDDTHTSYDPSSTHSSGPRISISSTRYSTEESLTSIHDRAYNHRHSLDSVAFDGDVLSFAPLRTPRRDSFIDMASPTSPDATASSDRANSTRTSSSSLESNRQSIKSASAVDPPDRRSSASAPWTTVLPRSGSGSTARAPASPDITPRRAESVDASRVRGSLDNSPTRSKRVPLPLPPTTNRLGTQERADLIRKTRKITKMFGQTPGADLVSQQYEPSRLLPSFARRGHSKGAVSVAASPVAPPRPASRPADEQVIYVAGNVRRHSTPLTPDDVTFLRDIPASRSSLSSLPGRESSGAQLETGHGDPPRSDWESIMSKRRHLSQLEAPGSPTSFMDLSDEEAPADSFSIASSVTPSTLAQPSPATPSLLENSNEEEQAEEERKRKRDRLAKLHRFLGSRVPADLVLGLKALELELPPSASPPPSDAEENESSTSTSKSPWSTMRRRNSVAAVVPTSWSDKVDRVKENLDDREKALNVRRAAKMEKMFGATPPQTLFHTRRSSMNIPTEGPSPPSPPVRTDSDYAQSSRPLSPVTTTSQTRTATPAKLRSKKKRPERPGTGDSSTKLLPYHSTPDDADMYTRIRNSIDSLNDIIDRDDRESLAELQEYLNSEVTEPTIYQIVAMQQGSSPLPSPRIADGSWDDASSRIDRRRSLPPRASMTSLASEYNAPVSSPPSSFQMRRKRAAKLTQFFGVNYREVVGDILESIETGVEEEGGRGNLRPEQVQDLLQSLRKLKTKDIPRS